jgi:hypothetical protein
MKRTKRELNSGKILKELVKKLKEFKKRVEKRHDLKLIILFGSRARKKFRKDSDVDLIIVGKFKGKNSLKRAPELYLEWDLDLPVDFLCYTPEEFNKLKNQVSIVKEAVENGIEI